MCVIAQTPQSIGRSFSSNVLTLDAMKTKDFYGVLGVERSVSADEIKRAYRNLARKYHPDVSDDPDGERKFKEVGEAYQTLKVPKMRSAYNRSLLPSQPIDWSQLSHGTWLGWLLWMHCWSSWERAWLKTMDTLR